jgi:hypothetical protein
MCGRALRKSKLGDQLFEGRVARAAVYASVWVATDEKQLVDQNGLVALFMGLVRRNR